MASNEFSGGKRVRDSKRELKRPQRRAGVRIDMTPMVDIAFLLLIFYMVTTVFARPTIMEIALPSKEADHEPEPVAESKLLRLFVDKEDSFYYKIGPHMDHPEKTDIKRLAHIIEEKNRNIDDLVMLLKLDHDASYSSMVDVIDIIQTVERQINIEIVRANGQNTGIEKDYYSVRFSLDSMNALDEYELEIANMEGRRQP